MTRGRKQRSYASSGSIIPADVAGIELVGLTLVNADASQLDHEFVPLLEKQEVVMPLFITQGRFTETAVKGMLATPEDRAETVSQLFARSGGKLIETVPANWTVM